MLNGTVSRSDNRIYFLDHFRGVAILLVFGFHALGVSYGMDTLKWDGWFRDFNVPRSFLALLPLTFGWSGVTIFFVISGFCIHFSHTRSGAKGFRTFFVRRFFRIYPPYLLATVFFAFLFPWTRLQLNSAEAWRQLVSHLSLAHSLDVRTFAGINPSFWSIAVEAQLYLFYPLLLLLVRRFGWKGTLWITGFIEVALRGTRGVFDVLPTDPFPNLFPISGPLFYWFSWTIGAKLADDWVHGTLPALRSYRFWLWSTLAIGSFFVRPLFHFCFLFVALTSLQAIIFFLSRPTIPLPVPQILLNHLRFVGLSSYSFYLFHQPLLGIVPWMVRKIFPGLQLHSYRIFLFCLVFYWPFLVFFYFFSHYVERNSNALGKRIILTRQEKILGN
jgi:peptidoglycan/LPS O-acetylase OafA/YrhL